jgi:pyruvate dehydrogenase E1 component
MDHSLNHPYSSEAHPMNAPDLNAAAFWRVAPPDIDARETREWLDALDGIIATQGRDRATYVLRKLWDHARAQQVRMPPVLNTPYRNTIDLAQQPAYPGDLALEARLGAIVRWNALAMVVRANRDHPELGGHIASYASAADLFEVGFNHFFRAGQDGDLVYFQPHSAPGVYARAFLEGRLSATRLDHYRREAGGEGLSSYPHPYLMPDFWQFPTGSMGLGPLNAIYQARFMRYLEHRGLKSGSRDDLSAASSKSGVRDDILAPSSNSPHDVPQVVSDPTLRHDAPKVVSDPTLRHDAPKVVSDPILQRKVWAFVGDGEMDEPESLAGLSLAAREGLDNLIFVVNCNLQRLDGPVRGNGSIIQELEGLFAGAGWNVIKLLWSSDWDPLFARDNDGVLLRRLHETVDGEFQTYAAIDGALNRERFFNRYPELEALVAHLTDADIDRLRRGGHDAVKIHAAYHTAIAHRGQPTVILAKTKKGYGMGAWGEGRMTTHQQKKLDVDALRAFRERFSLPLSDATLETLAFHHPGDDSPEIRYLHAQRRKLGGYLPVRRDDAPPVPVPSRDAMHRRQDSAPERERSTTTVLVHLLGQLLREAELGPRIVPIVADEARTFGMANLFRQVGIYSAVGQLYEPEDRDQLLYYREAMDGQILEEGITEAGAMASWVAAATSYSTHGVAMMPFYIYYSIFGFQRVGDLIWAAADARSRGFLVGATAGRTTLSGEGLQHQDGTSHLVAATIPNCRAYDPCFAHELVTIVQDGLQRMLVAQEDVFYYLTVNNENYLHLPSPPGSDDGILRGLYLFRAAPAGPAVLQLLASGPILCEALAAADALARDHGIAANVWSVTSWSEAARNPAWVAECLGGTQGPLIAASDYVRAVADPLHAHLPGRQLITLGTDGFGRSDTRAALRAHFGVDAASIVQASRTALGDA